MNQQVLAYYFPQYYSFVENDIVFGKDFTDWKLYNQLDTSIRQPIEPPTGLGYYDINDISIRKQQATLAKKYGVDGFIYYHYWLENKPVMDNIFKHLLTDNEPNLPFCLCFANESWKHCYGTRPFYVKT